MKRISQLMQPPYPIGSLRARAVEVRRRFAWLLPGATPAKLANLAVAGAQFALKHEVMRAWPVVVKIDISPLCNLHCTVCVHARPSESSSEELKGQSFSSNARMTVGQFQRITDEIAGKTMAVSLYYIGDPLMHPSLDEMCGIARDARLNSHISTNFSFKLSDARIASIVTSGLTHLTVCVDGLTQESYGRTRVGGRIALVLENLERIMRCRTDLGRSYPRVEVQYLKYQHNVGELGEAYRRFGALGVDQFTEMWGDLHNYTDMSPGQYEVVAPKLTRPIPQCLWPYFTLQIKYDGDVVPCVNYRMGPQYSDVGERRVLGNVFETNVWAVWNSPKYQALRRLVSRPDRVGQEPGLAKTFCDGCPQIYVTHIERNLRRANEHRWEDLYEMDDRRRVVRIADGRKPAAADNESRAVPVGAGIDVYARSSELDRARGLLDHSG
jgi:MoaA/NifB/PqqE/SkfB family radical SAM enzyme